MRSLISRFCDFYLDHYRISAAVALVILVGSGYFASRLRVNSDQLDLMPQDLPQVQEALKVNEMLGGIGYLILTVKFTEKNPGDVAFENAAFLHHRGDLADAEKEFQTARAYYRDHGAEIKKDAERLKKVADDLYGELKGLEELRSVRYKIDLDFLYRKAYFYFKTEDLREILNRARVKRDELIKKADPFYIELDDEPDYRFDISDILKKYDDPSRRVFADEYFISPDNRMLLILLKPKFSLNEIDRAMALNQKLQSIIDRKDYPKQGVRIDFTGTYVQMQDNYRAVRESLEPAGTLSMVGITLILLVFVRSKRMIGVMLASLLYAIVLTFGITYLVFGELNILTSMFGGILAGVGMDFGIYFVFRFREEFGIDHDLRRAVKDSILKIGGAAFFSASTIIAAYLSLIISGFPGFAEFGILSAIGVAITALCMFFLTPLLMVIIGKLFPRFLSAGIAIEESEKQKLGNAINRINLPLVSRVILLGGVVLLVGFGFAASKVRFERDTRRLVNEDAPSRVLYDEIGWRFGLAGDPLVIATDTLDEAASLWEYLEPAPEGWSDLVTRMTSVFTFVPPRAQQLRNYRLVQEFHAENRDIKLDMIPERYRGYYAKYLRLVGEKPFGAEELPDYLLAQFHSIPESSRKGWLTLISPTTAKLTYTDDLQSLEKMVGEFEYPVVGRHTIQALVDSIPAWEDRHGRVAGSREKPAAPDAHGFRFSEYERNGLLEIVNKITPEELESYGFFPTVNREILEKRPFNSPGEIQATKRLARTTGGVVLVAQFTYLIDRAAKDIILGTIGMMVLILLISFRNLRAVVYTLIPLFTGMVVILGLMALSDLRVNYFNITVIPVILGFGINAGIFLFLRFKESGSVAVTLYGTGTAVLASNLTALAGWGSIIIAHHVGLRSMGHMALIGIAVMMVASLTVLPAILQMLAEYRARLEAPSSPEAGE